MQGLADGYFIIPYSIGNYLGSTSLQPVSTNDSAFRDGQKKVCHRLEKLFSISTKTKNSLTVDQIHKELGRLLWDNCGMARNRQNLEQALAELPELQEKFWNNVYIPGTGKELNQSLERAGRVADFLEFAEMFIRDALQREESCGCHLREESQTEDHEAKRDDANYCHVSAWEYKGSKQPPVMHKEKLTFENVSLSQRSYK